MSIKCPVTTTVVFILIAGKQQYNLILYQESFNTNVIYQFFDNKITFVNLQHKLTNSKEYFVQTSRF